MRELQNCLERCLALAGDGPVQVDQLPPEVRARVPEHDDRDVASVGGFSSLFDVERRHILRVLEAVGGNKSEAARVLGIDRKTLHARLARYGRG